MEPLPYYAEPLAECPCRSPSELAAGSNAKHGEAGGERGAYAPQLPYGEIFQKPGDILGPYKDEPVGFAHVGGELGKELVRGYADRAGDAELLFHPLLGLPSERLGRCDQGEAPCYIYKRLVYGVGLH